MLLINLSTENIMSRAVDSLCYQLEIPWGGAHKHHSLSWLAPIRPIPALENAHLQQQVVLFRLGLEQINGNLNRYGSISNYAE